MSALCVLCQGLSLPPPPRLLASRLTMLDASTFRWEEYDLELRSDEEAFRNRHLARLRDTRHVAMLQGLRRGELPTHSAFEEDDDEEEEQS